MFWEDDAFKIKTGLLSEAKRLGKHETDMEAVGAALEHYVKWLRQTRILKLFGTIDFDPEYDYKEERRRKRNS